MSKSSEEEGGWFWGQYSALGLKIAVIVLLVDQAHKWWMLLGYRIQDKGRVPVLPFLDLVFVKNTGISYSMLDQSSYAWQIALAVFAVLASVAMWIWMAHAATCPRFSMSSGTSTLK